MNIKSTFYIAIVAIISFFSANVMAQEQPFLLITQMEGEGLQVRGTVRASTFNQKRNFVIQEVLWSFGDGNTSTEPAPVHRYHVGGRYMVCVEASGKEGKSRHCREVDVQEGAIKNHQGVQLAYDPGTKTLRALFDQETGMGTLRMERVTTGEVLWDVPLAGSSFELGIDNLPEGEYRFILKHPLGGQDRFVWKLP